MTVILYRTAAANAFAEDAPACRRAGMDSRVPKPVNVKFLPETILRLPEGKTRAA